MRCTKPSFLRREVEYAAREAIRDWNGHTALSLRPQPSVVRRAQVQPRQPLLGENPRQKFPRRADRERGIPKKNFTAKKFAEAYREAILFNSAR